MMEHSYGNKACPACGDLDGCHLAIKPGSARRSHAERAAIIGPGAIGIKPSDFAHPIMDAPQRPVLCDGSGQIMDETEKRAVIVTSNGRSYEVPEDVAKDWLELKCLVDGAYTTVELYKATTPYNVEWRKTWLLTAVKHGATPD